MTTKKVAGCFCVFFSWFSVVNEIRGPHDVWYPTVGVYHTNKHHLSTSILRKGLYSARSDCLYMPSLL